MPAPSPQAGDTRGMPVPPKQLKDLIEGTVDHHASQACPALQEVTIRWRGSYGYLIAWAGEGDDNDEQIPLCRIDYLGDDEDWGFALYDPATETHTRPCCAPGSPPATPTTPSTPPPSSTSPITSSKHHSRQQSVRNLRGATLGPTCRARRYRAVSGRLRGQAIGSRDSRQAWCHARDAIG